MYLDLKKFTQDWEPLMVSFTNDFEVGLPQDFKRVTEIKNLISTEDYQALDDFEQLEVLFKNLLGTYNYEQFESEVRAKVPTDTVINLMFKVVKFWCLQVLNIDLEKPQGAEAGKKPVS